MMTYQVRRTRVALRSANGRYMCAEGGGGGDVNVTRKERGIWETFELVELPKANAIGLITHDGHYVCAEGGGGGSVVANRDSIRAWETFDLIRLAEGPKSKIALRAHAGQYLCAEGGGGGKLTATRAAPLEWETFELVTIGDTVVVQLGTARPARGLRKALSESKTDEVGAYLCTTTTQDYDYTPRAADRFVGASVMSDILWPGSILDASSIPTGEYSPIIAERAPLTLSHTIPGVPTRITLTRPCLDEFREVLASLVESMGSEERSGSREYFEELVSSETQLSVALGGHYKKGTLEVSTNFDFAARSTKSKLLVLVTHVYFTIDVPPTQPARDFFTDRQRQIGENEVYIATVTYGQRLTFVMESAEEGAELMAAARVATDKGGGHVDLKYRKLLKDSKILLWEEGGTGGGALPIMTGADGIREYINKGENFKAGVQVAPLFYKMRLVRDPHPINYLSLTTSVNVRKCVRVTGTFRVTDGSIRRRGGAGREYFGTLEAQAFDSEGRLNEGDAGKKAVWRLSADNHVSLEKDKWTQTGCARQLFTWSKNLDEVKQTAYIEFSGTVYEWDKRSGHEELKSSATRIYLDKVFPQTVSMTFKGRRAAPLEFSCTVEALSE
jgi:thiol-activated cytolysin